MEQTSVGVTVGVPAHPESARVLRAVIGSVAATLDFSLDEIDDLRLALDEAFTQLLDASPDPPNRVVVQIDSSDGGVVVLAARDTGVEPWPPTTARGTLTWQVLCGLTDEASFDSTLDGPAIRFRKSPAGR